MTKSKQDRLNALRDFMSTLMRYDMLDYIDIIDDSAFVKSSVLVRVDDRFVMYDVSSLFDGGRDEEEC